MELAFAKIVPGAGEIEIRARLFFEAKNAVVESPRALEIGDQHRGVQQFPDFHIAGLYHHDLSQGQAAARDLDSRSRAICNRVLTEAPPWATGRPRVCWRDSRVGRQGICDRTSGRLV